MNLSWIPNTLSLGNLFLGFLSVILSIIMVSQSNDLSGQEAHPYIKYIALCILGAGVLDVLDGRIARSIKHDNPIGKELDSLADLASFGIAPGIMFYVLFFAPNPYYASPFQDYKIVGAVIAFLFPVFGALRLAKFNITETPGYFIGIPSPIAGGGCALLLTFNELPAIFDPLKDITADPITFTLPWQLALAIFVFYAILMYSRFVYQKTSPSFMNFSKRNSLLRNVISVIFLASLVVFFKFFLFFSALYYTLKPILSFRRAPSNT
ncbi:MAG: CDP-alcohol phosphatidyltransferase family protein [Spirochaetota bacterium]|nr:CDP-alcohol phosphatidyltransferase family protein [Spirochaetota bacterium]